MKKNVNRQKIISTRKNNFERKKEIYPLCDYNITESQAFEWCKENDLLNPCYAYAKRGGCWFCYNQSSKSLCYLKKYHPEYWNMLLKWDRDAPYKFHYNQKTVREMEPEIMKYWEEV